MIFFSKIHFLVEIVCRLCTEEDKTESKYQNTRTKILCKVCLSHYMTFVVLVLHSFFFTTINSILWVCLNPSKWKIAKKYSLFKGRLCIRLKFLQYPNQIWSVNMVGPILVRGVGGCHRFSDEKWCVWHLKWIKGSFSCIWSKKTNFWI